MCSTRSQRRAEDAPVAVILVAVAVVAIVVAFVIKGVTEFLHRWCASFGVHTQRQDLHQRLRGLLLRLRQNLRFPKLATGPIRYDPEGAEHLCVAKVRGASVSPRPILGMVDILSA